LQPILVSSRFSSQELGAMRTHAGATNSTGGDTVEDFKLRGLDELLKTVASLSVEQAAKKASLLWDALCDVEDRRGARAFSGTYRWYYFHRRSCDFDAAFVHQLNEVAWVPGRDGTLQPPAFVIFEATGWKSNPFLASKIKFKPPILEVLAREAGIEPGVLDLLKRLGVTNEAELRARLGINEEAQQTEIGSAPGNIDDAVKNILGSTLQPTPPVPDPSGPEPTGGGGATGGSGTSWGGGSGAGGRSGTHTGHSTGGGGKTSGNVESGHNSTPSGVGARNFISYLAAHPEGEVSDPDGLDQQSRLALEEQAIAFILSLEPELQRTPTNNPGFDLMAVNGSCAQVKWVEVKAMSGTMEDRPVGMSRNQFDCAREHGEAYWLYIVEHADLPNQARIVRIQDPAGQTRTFTFDHGWLSIAEADVIKRPKPDEDGVE
jgi:hypothetical protein